MEEKEKAQEHYTRRDLSLTSLTGKKNKKRANIVDAAFDSYSFLYKNLVHKFQ